MVSILKNQLLKHLSRFTKNLSADKINLSTFKGEGELSNLELDELVLSDLLELPSWLQLTKAWCNHVSFRIHWTKLKTVPIFLNLDEVNIIVETCEELRLPTSPNAMSQYSGLPGKYSFVHKIIDGITIAVNTVNITFNSPAFTASVQISKILVESKSPTWKRTDLRLTRLKDPDKGQVLIFKELEWQTVRIEAKSTEDKDLSPLRLLTNQARCRMTIKKRLLDCFIISSCLVLILDDLLWVLTDSQLKAALHFLDSLSGLVQKASELTRKEKARRKLEVLPEYQAQMAQQEQTNANYISKVFSSYDVIETSYHFLSQQIILHLCDDPGDGRSGHPNLKDGGALQICLRGFQVDYYPYHLASGDRKHWPLYKEEAVRHSQWLDQSLNSFRSKFIDLIEKNRTQHTPLTRSSQTQNQTPVNKPTSNDNQSNSTQNSPTSESSRKISNPITSNILKQLAKLMTICIIIKIEDFTLYRVTTSGKKQALKEFISGDQEHALPNNSNVLHAEFTYYYYPGDMSFPLPPPKCYIQIDPIQIYFDIDSCLWLNSFALNLHHSLMSNRQDITKKNMVYIDVRLEAIWPRIIFESSSTYTTQKDRPKSLHCQVTRVTITNVRSLEHSSRADLAKCVDSFHMGSLFFGSEFPSQPTDFYIVTQKFLDHITTTDNIRNQPEFNSSAKLTEMFTRDMLWTDAKDVWCISLDPVWIDFFGTRSVGNSRPIPFLDAVPVTVWIHLNMEETPEYFTNEPKTGDVHALAHISNLVSFQINHYQYLFLLRMAEDLTELAMFLALDSNRILKQDTSKSIVVGAILPQVEVTFVMPSQNPGKESSGADLEYAMPDSSSIADDVLISDLDTVGFPSSSSMNDLIKKSVYPFKKDETEPSHLKISSSDDLCRSPGVKTIDSSTQNTFLPNNFSAGLSSMRNRLSSLKTSIDATLRSSPDDMSDRVSIHFETTSKCGDIQCIYPESGEQPIEKKTIFKLDCDPLQADTKVNPMFSVQGGSYEMTAKASAVEVATEVIEEENTVTTPSEHSFASTFKRNDLVSVSTFKLSKVEFLQQSSGFASSIKIQVSNIVSDECGSIPWDEFQSKFSSRSRAWIDVPANSNTSTRVKLRLDHDINSSLESIAQIDLSDRNKMKQLFKDIIYIQVNDIELDLNMSTVTGLADLTEDEIVPIQIPMEICVDNIYLHIVEDRPPNNITSPGPIPLHFKVNQLFIHRDANGVFHIMPQQPKAVSNTNLSVRENQDRELEMKTMQLTIRQIKSDNDELKRRLLAFDRISEENRVLRKTKEEASILKTCLNSAQDDVAKLIDDKKMLLDRLQCMEDRLKQCDQEKLWNSKR